MSERSADDRLYALRCLEKQVQLGDLERTRRWIADAERQAGEEQRQQEQAEQPPPEWLAQRDIGIGPVTIHTTLGDRADACWGIGVDYARVRPITQEQALRALDEDGAEACDRCRPDTVLGLL